MATLALATASPAGTLLGAVAAAAGGDVFPNDGKTALYVKNGGGSSITVTIAPQNTVQGLSLASLAVTVAASAERIIGPFPPAFFNNASGQVSVAYSAVTSVTVSPIQISS